jgi:tyrosine-protein phosphatase
LKLQWSHGQQDLVEQGFPAAMEFTDAAIERGDGVLIHCQCGISRSATMVIALVMRAAAQSLSSVPPEVWELKGYQAAYSFVKEKSKWVGPNMSLIYQLLEYERSLKPLNHSSAASEGSSAMADEEEEWGRRRQMMEESEDQEDDDRESSAVIREAQALDKAMEERIIARKSSVSSMSSSGVGMGPAWRSRYSSRKRAGSIASNMTAVSVLTEDLVEEEEEQELLGIGGGFDDASLRDRSPSLADGSTESTNSPDEEPEESSQSALPFTPLTARNQVLLRPPPSAPAWKMSFNFPPPPASASRASFDLPSRPPVSKLKGKRRPPPIGILPPVPSSPVTLIAEPVAPAIPSRLRTRTESRKPAPPPLHLRSTLKVPFTPKHKTSHSVVSTPSQTLFVFPPETTLTARTPSTMTLTTGPIPFPSISTPRVSTFRSHGRTRSFIGLGPPPIPTTACSIVDARGWVGLE